MYVAIVDDEIEARENLHAYLLDYCSKHDISIAFDMFPSAEDFLKNYQAKYDVVFMDIELKDMNGLEASHKLREIDQNVVLVFVTNYVQYAVTGYEVNAFDYIVKPISYENFIFKFERVLSKLEYKNNLDFLLLTNNGTRKIKVRDILYVEVFRHTLVYHMNDGNKYSSRGALNTIEEKLSNQGFAKCNRCYLVNLFYVDSVDDFVLNIANEKLIISHPTKKSFMKALADYIGRGGDV